MLTTKNIPLFKVAMDPAAKLLVGEVLDSGYVGQGPKVELFEKEFAKAINKPDKKILSTNSCTSALILALKTINLLPGDLVISTSMTCTATNAAILQVGGRIVWADVDKYTGLICPISVAKLVGHYGNRIRAIIAVDWGGTLCNYTDLKKAAKNIPIIQDAAHCLKIGDSEHGDFVAWSFGPIKHLTMTDGGALLTPQSPNQDLLYNSAKLLRWFGIDRDTGDSFRCSNLINHPGGKYHANDVQATIGLANLKLALNNVEIARSNAKFYQDSLKELGEKLILPPSLPSNSWWLYSIVAPGQRDKLINYLTDKGISASPVHARNDMHPVYIKHAEEPIDKLEGLDFFASGQLSIPVGWWVTKDNREYIVETIKKFFKNEKD